MYHTCLIHSFADGHLGCFPHLAIVNCAAMNIQVHKFFRIGVSGFLGYNPSSGITRSVEYYIAEIKKELLPFMTAWMDLESIMLSEIIQAVKDKYHMISPISGT